MYFILLLIFAGCTLVSSDFIPNAEVQLPFKPESSVTVFYDKNEVPYAYKEIGRVFIKNINYWADRDPGGQIKEVKRKAALSGADAVIICQEKRRESSFLMDGYSAGGSASDVYQTSGIAIVWERN